MYSFSDMPGLPGYPTEGVSDHVCVFRLLGLRLHPVEAGRGMPGPLTGIMDDVREKFENN